jgi:hypothetical protein
MGFLPRRQSISGLSAALNPVALAQYQWFA